MKYLRTPQPEHAAKRLCKRHNLVVALQWLVLPQRMPLRLSEITGTQLYHVRRKSEADATVRAWHKTGGLYIREYSGRTDYGHAEATLRVEAPLDLDTLEGEAMACAKEFVICNPTRWDFHRAAIIDLFPPSGIAARFWSTLEVYRDRRPRNIDLAMLKMMELPEVGTVCIPKTEFYKKANVTVHQMNRLRGPNSLMIDRKRADHYCTPVTLRFEPTDRPDYLALYKWIEENCQRYLQYHVIRNSEPSANFPFWKSWLRNMHYKGFIQREDEINFWMPASIKPDFAIYDAEHAEARERLEKVIAFVAALPELKLE